MQWGSSTDESIYRFTHVTQTEYWQYWHFTSLRTEPVNLSKQTGQSLVISLGLCGSVIPPIRWTQIFSPELIEW